MFVEEIDTSKLVRNKRPVKVVGRSTHISKRGDQNTSVISSKQSVPANRFDSKRVTDEMVKIELDARRNKAASELLEELKPIVTGTKLVARTMKGKRSVTRRSVDEH